MTIDPAIAMLSPFIGLLVGAALQYLLGRAAETRRQLVQQRTQSYIDYFKALAVAAQKGRSSETLALAADAKVRICIYGSPKVVKRLHDFDKLGATVNTTESKIVIAELIREMRRDSGTSRSPIDQDVLLPILFARTSVKDQASGTP